MGLRMLEASPCKDVSMSLQWGQVQYDVEESTATVRATGDIDVATAPEFRDALYRLIDGGEPTITVDMGAVSFIDSSGLGALVAAQKRARKQGATITVANLTSSARKLFEITGLLDVFGVAQS